MDELSLAKEDTFPISSGEEQPVYSVSLISKVLKDVIESSFSGIRVKGEVSGFKRHTSGHCYFSLKDNDAVMDAVCWRGTPKSQLLRDGLEIIAFGKVTTYPGRSKYQMVISSFDPSGEGALLQLLLQLKEKLLKEGLFDARHKKEIPTFPRRIGVITSPTGAVLRDILHRLRERFPCHVLLKPVLVQGDGSAEQIRDAIDVMNNLPAELKPDVLIVARGGGSLEDLFTFNDESLVRTAFASSIPIVSAIGHETDYTLLDFVADLRAPTPTAAAELATPVLPQLLIRLQELQLRLSQVSESFIKTLILRLSRFEQTLKDPLRYVFEKQQKLDDWSERLQLGIRRFLVQRRLQFGQITLTAPRSIINLGSERLFQHGGRLLQSYKHYNNMRCDRLMHLSQQLENVSFKKTLERGFCFAESEQGKVLHSKDDIKMEKPFNLHFKDGISKVRAIPSSQNQGTLF